MQPPRDPVLLSLLPEFLTHWEALLTDAEWERLRASGDPAGLHRLGHTVRGSFAQFGMQDGADIGTALMECASKGEWGRARMLFGALRAGMAEVRLAVAVP